tara:strand:- start:5822 stop:6385 length:564 start_codon:yes stop_codon:yes gene_type:complete
MSDLGLTIAGNAQSLPDSYHQKKGVIISVTPTVATGAGLVGGDILFNAVELPKAVRQKGGLSKLVNITGTNISPLSVDHELIFHKVYKVLGVIHAPPTLSDTALLTLGHLGHLRIQSADWSPLVSSGTGSGITYMQALESHADRSLPLMVQAEDDKTSIWVSSLALDSYNITGASDMTWSFHFEYLD